MANKNVSKSELLHEKLIKLSIKFSDIENKEINFSEVSKEIKTTFEQLYNISKIENYFWEYCPFSVYKKTLPERAEKFKNKYFDSNIEDFIRNEINTLGSNYSKKYNDYFFHFPGGEITGISLNEILGEEFTWQIHYTQLRKIDLWTTNEVLQILNIKRIETKETNKTANKYSNNDFPEIFTEGGYKIFKFLNEKYQKDNNSPKAKYSYLFHFLNYEGYLCCNHSDFINFLVSEKYIDKISKIQPENIKYKDTIQPLLHRYLKGFN